jgi:uncharacterized membrane protein
MSTAPSEFDRDEREIEFSRALAFSDGVFAFAVTLLVTTIDVPRLTGADIEGQLLHRIDDVLPQMGSYFLSFAVIGLMWMRHHSLFSRIRRMDRATLWLNMLALSFVVLMPFSTEVIGKYGDEAPSAVGLYALNIAAASFAFTALWLHCVRNHLLDERPTAAQIRLELSMRMLISVGFLLSIPIAYLSTSAAELSWFGVAIVQRLFRRRYAAAGRIDPEDG